jgi:hypothetical protein
VGVEVLLRVRSEASETWTECLFFVGGESAYVWVYWCECGVVYCGMDGWDYVIADWREDVRVEDVCAI